MKRHRKTSTPGAAPTPDRLACAAEALVATYERALAQTCAANSVIVLRANLAQVRELRAALAVRSTVSPALAGPSGPGG
jgi:hypothetical protein